MKSKTVLKIMFAKHLQCIYEQMKKFYLFIFK